MFTCNLKGKEIQDSLLEGHRNTDKQDLIARVFHQKQKLLLLLLLKDWKIFGGLNACMYPIECQKWGPLSPSRTWCKERIRPETIDEIICAELHNPEQDTDDSRPLRHFQPSPAWSAIIVHQKVLQVIYPGHTHGIWQVTPTLHVLKTRRRWKQN